MENINQNLADVFALIALLETAPDALLERLHRAGLPDADRWDAFRQLDGAGKTIIGTALDGDLESRAARYLLEGNSGGVLTGLLTVARAVGAARAIAVIPAGFRNTLSLPEGLCHALKSRLNIQFQIIDMPVSLVAAEPTALLRFLEGRQAIPYLHENGRPFSLSGRPFSLSGRPFSLNGASALVIPAETLAQATAALQKTEDGTCGEPGAFDAAIVTLAGAVRNPCTLKVPYGTTLGALLRDAGGTPIAEIKAVRVGGPAGLLLGADALDTTMLDAAFNENHGFGSLLLDVIPAGACAVETARDALRVLHAASCGKCVFCREGTLHLSAILEDIASGEGRLEDLEQLEDLARQMRTGCICALGRWASEPVLGSLALFREDFRNHILLKECSFASRGGDVHA